MTIHPDIIIITKNRYDTLLRCVKNIVSNTVSPQKIIIIHSQKPSLCITKKQIIRICKQHHISIVYRHVDDLGISYSRNKGLLLVTSDIFAFIDDDEIPPPNWIETACTFLAKHPEITVICGPKIPHIQHNYWNDVWGSLYRPQDRYAGFTDFAGSSNAFYRTKIFKKYHISYDVQFATSSEDRVVCFQLENAGAKIYYDYRLFTHHDFRTTTKQFIYQWLDYGKTMFAFANKYKKVASVRGHIDFISHSLCGYPVMGENIDKIPGLIVCDASFIIGYLQAWRINK